MTEGLVGTQDRHPPDVDDPSARFDHQAAGHFGRQRAGREDQAPGADRHGPVPAENVHRDVVELVALHPVREVARPRPAGSDAGQGADPVGGRPIIGLHGEREPVRGAVEDPPGEVVEESGAAGVLFHVELRSPRGGCGYSGARPWKARMAGFWITPSRISMALRMVSSASQASLPAITVRRKGRSASLISQVAEFQRYEGLWSTA